MAEPHISTFRVFAPYRIVTLLYPSNIGPVTPKFSDRPFSENSSNSIGRWHNFPKVVLAELWGYGNVLNQKQNRHCHISHANTCAQKWFEHVRNGSNRFEMVRAGGRGRFPKSPTGSAWYRGRIKAAKIQFSKLKMILWGRFWASLDFKEIWRFGRGFRDFFNSAMHGATLKAF